MSKSFCENEKQITTLPLFSVIILTYLQRHFIEECIDSVLMQDYPNIELVVCDDCSADFDTQEVMLYVNKNKRSNIKNVIIYKQPHNVGTTKNAQIGVDLSHGTYFKLHAGDDLLFDQKVLSSMAKMLSNHDINLVAGRSVACQKDGKLTEHYYPSMQAVTAMMDGDAKRQFELMGTQSWGEYINAPAVFWKRRFFDKIGGFDLSYKYTEDWPTWLKITGLGYRITMTDQVTTIYRYGGISNDSSSLNLTLGKSHYLESIQALETYALQKFQEEHNRKKILRCQQSIRCLEVRIETEGNWETWSLMQNVLWRIRNADFLFISWIYRKRMYGLDLPCKGLYKLLLLSFVMFVLHPSIWNGHIYDKFWAWVFLITLTCVAVRKGFAKSINLMNSLLNKRRGHD